MGIAYDKLNTNNDHVSLTAKCKNGQNDTKLIKKSVSNLRTHYEISHKAEFKRVLNCSVSGNYTIQTGPETLQLSTQRPFTKQEQSTESIIWNLVAGCNMPF